MSLFLPVASRLSSRTGLTLSRLLLPLAAAIVMGGGLTMVGNSPLILLNDLLVAANANMPSGAATLEPLNMFAPMPIGLALLAASLAYFHFFGSKRLREDEDEAVTPARTQSYFARAYGIDGDVYELTVTADSPLVGMSVGDTEALRGAPLLLALRTGEYLGSVHGEAVGDELGAHGEVVGQRQVAYRAHGQRVDEGLELALEAGQSQAVLDVVAAAQVQRARLVVGDEARMAGGETAGGRAQALAPAGPVAGGHRGVETQAGNDHVGVARVRVDGDPVALAATLPAHEAGRG